MLTKLKYKNRIYSVICQGIIFHFSLKLNNQEIKPIIRTICDPGAQNQSWVASKSQKYIVWVKMIKFSLCQKSLGY